MNEVNIAERVVKTFKAGEDWVITDAIKHLVPLVVREIQRRGGTVGTVGHGRIVVRNFVLDDEHAVPLDIQLYEGTYYPGKVLVDATIKGRHPLPIENRQPFDAKAVVDCVAEAFMSLVNYRASSRTAGRNIYRPGIWVDIGCEVLSRGRSSGWVIPKIDDPMYQKVARAAMDTEMLLRKFNIGYTDDMRGEWTHVTGGMRFFEGMV